MQVALPYFILSPNNSVETSFLIIVLKLLFNGARKEGEFKKKLRVAPVQQKLNNHRAIEPDISHRDAGSCLYQKKKERSILWTRLKFQ